MTAKQDHLWRLLDHRSDTSKGQSPAAFRRDRATNTFAKETAFADCQDRARVRDVQAKDVEASAQEVRKLLQLVDPGVAQRCRSAIRVGEMILKQVEEASLVAKMASSTQSGTRDALRTNTSVAFGAVQRAEAAVRLAAHAAALSDEPFGEALAHQVALALRAGAMLQGLPEEKQYFLGTAIYEGVGLSYGSTALREGCAGEEAMHPHDEVSFSVLSFWPEFQPDGEPPTQGCAPIVQDMPGPHTGPNGFSPQELDPQACRSLPSVLRWTGEADFVRFLAARSDRSLALLLGSGRMGGITKAKCEALVAAAERPETTGGDARHPTLESASTTRAASIPPSRVGAESVQAMQRLDDHRGTLEALERAIADTEVRPPEDPIGAKIFLEQAIAELQTLEERATRVPTAGLGIAGSAAVSLQQDLLRHTVRLRGRAAQRLSGFFVAPVH